jgi:hypothetical protein
MTDPELKLAELWDQDETPGRDAAFVIAVMERVERRRMFVAAAWLAVLTAAFGVSAWALAPVLQALAQPLVQAGPGLGALAAGAALAAMLWSWGSRQAVLSEA